MNIREMGGSALAEEPGTDGFRFSSFSETASGRCLLLESRLALRRTVGRALRAAGVFDQVVEAESFTDGLKQLSNDTFRACVIGSSVSSTCAVNFVRHAGQVSQNREITFITLVSDEGEEVLLGMEGDDTRDMACLPWPASIGELRNGILLAVRKTGGSQVRGELLEEPVEPASLLSFVSSDALDLTEIVARVRRGELGLDDTRRPTRAAREAISAVVDRMFPVYFRSKRVGDFRGYFEGALLLWFVELITHSLPFANDNLRRRLRLYVSQAE